MRHMAVTVQLVGEFIGFPGSDRFARLEEVQALRTVEGKMVEMFMTPSPDV
jgi:hypothetical protein